MPLTQITDLPPAPQRTDAPVVFAEKSDVFVRALSTLQIEVNALGTDLNAFTDGAALVQFANYAGTWQAGAYALGESVYHATTGQFWISNTADNEEEPPHANWLRISDAGVVSFDPAAGGLTGATNVQAAIDAIVPTGGKVAKARLPAGSILQVVQGTTSTEVAVTTTTYTDTELAATITPSSNTSKILVMIDQSVYVYRATDNALAGVRLLRGSTVIHDSRSNPGEPEELGFAIEGSGVTSIMFSWRYNLMILDAPNTSNAITYKTQGRPRTSTNGETVAFQESGDSVNATSRIVLMEVAG